MSSHDMFFEGIVVAYKFHSIDAYGDDTYFFKFREQKQSG